MTREEKAAYNYARERLANIDYPVYNDEYELVKAFKKGIHYGMNHPHWISVEDELPKDSCYILVASRGIVHHWRYGVLESADVLKNMYGITHWMPMPEAPKSGSSEIPNYQERRVIGTADHIKTALDVLNKEGGEE